jgi:DNA-binding beta-propeller fold protein YncE
MASRHDAKATVTTLAIPGLGQPSGIFVLADGTRIISSSNKTILQLPPSGRLTTIAGYEGEPGELKDGRGGLARFNGPRGLTVDSSGNVVVVDALNHALRTVAKAGAVVNTLAGNGEAGFEDGQGQNARFNNPHSVVVTANGDFIVSDYGSNSIRVVTPGGTVRTLCGNGQEGFEDGQGAVARFNCPASLALDLEGNVLVADFNNSAIRRVTMAGVVSTVAGNGEKGFADGEGKAARFNQPIGIVVDGEGAIVVADNGNNRLRKIVGRQVTTLAGSSEAGTADGEGANARFNQPFRLALDERGRLLVTEFRRHDQLRVVEASLAAPLWMGPVEEAGVTVPAKAHAAIAALLQDYAKMVENSDSELADVVLLVDGERFPAHRCVLAARSEYFRGLFLSGMQEGTSEGGVQKIGEVSAGAFRVVIRYLYSAQLPEGGAGTGGGQGAGGDGEDATEGQVLERAVLKAADLFRLEELLQHCVEAFGRRLKVDTAVEQLVWAHTDGPAEARTVATEYMVRNGRRIRVGTICRCVSFWLCLVSISNIFLLD